MSALPRGVYANQTRPLYEPNKDPLVVSSILGLSSINGSPYSPGGGGGGTISVFSTLTASSFTVSSINGNIYPPNAISAYAQPVCVSSIQLPSSSTFLVPWDNDLPNSGINASNTDVVVGVAGVYKIGCSYQFNNQSGNDIVRYFFLHNDNPINGTASFQTIGNNTEQVCYSEILYPLIAGDKIQAGVFTASSDIYLSTLGAPVGSVPTSPAAILTIYKID